VQLEQVPDPDNRVRLSSVRDAFGAPAPELSLRLRSSERRAHERTLAIAADALGLKGSRIVKQLQLMVDAGRCDFFWHHMGTTRMADDPAAGVVDADCRVHGVSNLFVAGSSVFPTGGIGAPTLTIVALALRLADVIRGERAA
jgi:choline dehydrogenase-like flavoprotein